MLTKASSDLRRAASYESPDCRQGPPLFGLKTRSAHSACFVLALAALIPSAGEADALSARGTPPRVRGRMSRSLPLRPMAPATGTADPPVREASDGAVPARTAAPDPASLLRLRLRHGAPPAAPGSSWPLSGGLLQRARHVPAGRSAPASPAAAPAPPAGPRSPGAFSRARGWKISSARATPGLDTVFVEVRASEEALLCYRQGANDLELAVRAPLMLATAAQAPNAPDVVCVTLPGAEELREVAGGLQAAPGQARAAFQGEPLLPERGGPLVLECGTELQAQQLLDQLSAAGCVLQGLTQR
ncbi:unnamed protein product, partial [Prorocentrum cordatum]